jgi:hypothetical protein
MTSRNFNPIGIAVNLVIGWFVVSFLQTALRSLLSEGWTNFWARFMDTAFFRNGAGVFTNMMVIVVCGGIGTALWFLLKK